MRNESYMGALRRKIGNDLVISPSVAGAQRADDDIAAVQTEWPFALTAC